MSITIDQLISFFFIYSFLGWCTEVCFQALSKGKLVNRGFLNGAVCPIYGVGVVLVVWLLEPLAACGPLLFAGAVVLCSVLEWLTGFVLEKLFHQKWWDYSGEPFNICGYICLKFSIMWGLACVFVVYMIHPTIMRLVDLMPQLPLRILLFVFGAVFILDCAATIKTMLGLNRQLRSIDEGAERLRELSDDLTEKLYEGSLKAKGEAERVKEETEEWKTYARTEADSLRDLAEQKKQGLKEKAEAERKALEKHKRDIQAELTHKLTRGQKRLLKAFPNVRSINYAEAMEEMKRHFDEHMRQNRK